MTTQNIGHANNQRNKPQREQQINKYTKRKKTWTHANDYKTKDEITITQTELDHNSFHGKVRRQFSQQQTTPALLHPIAKQSKKMKSKKYSSITMCAVLRQHATLPSPCAT